MVSFESERQSRMRGEKSGGVMMMEGKAEVSVMAETASQRGRREDVEKGEEGGDGRGNEGEEGGAGLEGRNEDEEKAKLPFTKARGIALVVTVTGAAFLNTLGVQSAVIILPTIGRDLNIPPARQQWIVSAYNLTFGCFLLLWGRLADVYGKRIIFIGGSVWVALASIIVPFVPNEIGFDVFRGLQGLGAAAMVPTAIGILGTTFPPGKAKNYAFSCYAAGAPMGSIFGNLFGGVVGEYLNWRWVFWIFGILAALCTVAGILIIPPPPPPPPQSTTPSSPKARNSIDWLGGAIITAGLVLLLFALSEGNVVGWRTPWVSILIVLSFVLILTFGFYQHFLEKQIAASAGDPVQQQKRQRPLMKMSIFKNVKFTAANIVMMLFFASFNQFLIYATFWFQEYQGLSVIQTTLRFIPTGVTGIAVAFLTSQLLSLLPTLSILTFGTVSLSLASLLFALPLAPKTSYWAYGFPAMILSVCGADTLFPTLTLYVARSLPDQDQALGGALVNSVGQIGRALGLAVATAVQGGIVKSVGGGDGGGGVLRPWDERLRVGIRGTCWLNFGMGVAALVVVLLAFRGGGRVGGKGKL